MADKVIAKEYIEKKTKPIEANIIGCFWHNPELFLYYTDFTKDDFKNDIWKFYFLLGKKISAKGVKKIDEIAVEIFLDGKDKLLEVYNNYGGYEIIDDLEMYITEENVESYINELKKWGTVYNLLDKFAFTEDKINKLQDLNVDEVYSLYTAELNNVFINVNDDVETSKLDEDLDKIIENAHEGLEIGMPLKSPMLSEEIGGWINGQVYIMGGLSGAGKSSISQEIVLSSVWELNEPCVIMLNEQDHVKWKQQFITFLINNVVLKDTKYKFNAKRWRQGKFSDIEFEWINSARDMIKKKEISGQIIFVHFKSYSQKKAERIIRKYASLGIKKFVLDTFKLSSERNDNEAFWLSMQEDMRKFDDLVKKSNLNVGLWCTLQLQKGSRLLRYLTGDNVGMAKNVIDVASVAILMRRLWNDEYTGKTHEIEVKKPIAGTNSFTVVNLDPNKQYVIIFIEKNRNGASQTYQIVAEQDLGTLTYKEIGICDIPFGS